MGGPGSGNWYRWQGRKSTVEESLTLSIKNFRDSLFNGAAGTFTWTWNRGGKSSIGYRVTRNDCGVRILLHYRKGESDDIEVPVHLEITPTQFGGQRWWFTCPLMAGGRACDRRVGKLHLPPGARYFGCRTCHKLSYRSSQEAHSTERVFARLGFTAEDARNFDRIGRENR